MRNVGMYRVQRFDATAAPLHWQIHQDAAADWRGIGGRMNVAVALGLDPITAYSAFAPLPQRIDELMLTRFLRRDPVDFVRRRTVDLEVPARAAIVIKGYVERGGCATRARSATTRSARRSTVPVLHVAP